MRASGSEGVRRVVRHGGPPQGTTEAKQRAAAILEVLAGTRTPAQAAADLGTSMPRYYLWEQRALQGLVTACEPRPPGRGPNDARRIAELERSVARWERECLRQQALARAMQRAVGLSAPPSGKPAAAAPGKKSRRRRPTVRALRAASALRSNSSSPETPQVVEPGAEHGQGGVPAAEKDRMDARRGVIKEESGHGPSRKEAVSA
jgi:hypothetical protein